MLCALFGVWCPQVDAYYYPDRNDLSVHEVYLDVGSVENCRGIVYDAAARRGDPRMKRGDYECGVNPRRSLGTLTVYEETVQ